jgi:putative spermidine/putrescine transport system ATP-binding protein
VAGFVGTLNQLQGTVEDPASGAVRVGGATVVLGQPLRQAKGAAIALALRPEALRLGRETGREVVMQGRIAEVEFLGSVIRIRADIEGNRLSLDTFNRPDAPPPAIGALVELSASARDFIPLAD